nr:hypothetical protein [Armatimonas sp.]
MQPASLLRLFGQRARLTLNHDAVFLGELLLALEQTTLPTSFTARRCFSLLMAAEIPPALAYAAAANVVLPVAAAAISAATLPVVPVAKDAATSAEAFVAAPVAFRRKARSRCRIRDPCLVGPMTLSSVRFFAATKPSKISPTQD